VRPESKALRGQRLRADLTLLAVAILWGSAFVVCRLAAAQTGSFLYNGSRFLLGALTLLPLVAARLRGLARVEVWGGALAGALLFAASGLQQIGLQFTTAGKAGFITSLYVVLVPFFLALVWRQWPRGFTWAASISAAVGLFLLSAVEHLALAPGDGLELVGAVFWALHVILIGRLAPRVDVLRLALMQYLVCALLSLAAGLMFELSTAPGLVSAWWAVLYTGIFSVGLGYTLQVVGQQRAPAADAAVILSGEAVFAALAGWLVLGERLAPWQLLGCALMLAGMILAQASTWRQGGRAQSMA
jgi:drug/metabolite transporter (DMT)-like permease